MKKNLIWTHVGMILIVCLPLVYLLIIWNQVPPIVPLHFNSQWQPDRMDRKSALWTPVLVLAGVSVLVYFLLRNIERIDPKRRGQPKSPIFNKLAGGLIIFMTALNFIIIISAVKGVILIKHFLFPLLGLLFAFIGNYMNNLKPNYFAGFRLPWTLSDNENWRKTHHLASKLWFWGGLLLTVVSLSLPFTAILPVYITLIVIMSLIPAIYSYRLFKQKL